MHHRSLFRLGWIVAIAVCFAIAPVAISRPVMTNHPQLLTDPFLQLPTPTTVNVAWFTEFAGTQHWVTYGENLEFKVAALTTKLQRTREDPHSNIPNPPLTPVPRPIWRHEATITGLPRKGRVPYQVTSLREDGASVSSQTFTLASAPASGTASTILLTSDHQLKPMVAANLQKVAETMGQLDLVLMAGDLINVPDRASEWFDDRDGGAFFPAFQGRASYDLEKDGTVTRYQGGPILQYTPIYTAIGNHEVMGRFSAGQSLKAQFGDAVPHAIAATRYEEVAEAINPTEHPGVQAAWLKNHSFNTDTYEEIWTLPESPLGGKRYYAVTFGDVRLIVLYATNVWRSPSLEPNSRGKYRERSSDLSAPQAWGWGQHIFESIAKGSPQYTWLAEELQSPEFQQAKYKIVMLHNPPHSLGENSVPAFTDPVQVIERNTAGEITAIRYEYPTAKDYLVQDLVPLLEQAGVQLVFFGHSHLWNRFASPSGMHFLETSNVGNSYGAYLGETRRQVPTEYHETYAPTGNPNGLTPIVPTIAPLLNADGQPLPYIASNDITVFSIFDTSTGRVSSYRFDTRLPQSAVIKFDEFELGRSPSRVATRLGAED